MLSGAIAGQFYFFVCLSTVAIQGVKGCFHEQAARLFYEEHGQAVPDIVECLTFDDLYRSMNVLPLEQPAEGIYLGSSGTS